MQDDFSDFCNPLLLHHELRRLPCTAIITKYILWSKIRFRLSSKLITYFRFLVCSSFLIRITNVSFFSGTMLEPVRSMSSNSSASDMSRSTSSNSSESEELSSELSSTITGSVLVPRLFLLFVDSEVSISFNSTL